MKFKTRFNMHSTPDFKANVAMEPVAFTTSARGAFSGTLGAVSATVDEVPLRLAIPFLRRKGKLPLIGTIGGFKIKLNPLNIKIEDASVQLDGVLGTKGIKSTVNTKVLCDTEVKMNGAVSGKLGSFNVKLEEEALEED